MSQNTNYTDLNEDLDGDLFKEYYDELFRQIPLPLSIDLPKTDKITDEAVVVMKCKWLIEYLTETLTYKTQAKGMVKVLLDLASERKNKDKIFKNIGHLKVMLKDTNCEMEHLHSFIALTIFMASIEPDM